MKGGVLDRFMGVGAMSAFPEEKKWRLEGTVVATQREEKQSYYEDQR